MLLGVCAVAEMNDNAVQFRGVAVRTWKLWLSSVDERLSLWEINLPLFCYCPVLLMVAGELESCFPIITVDLD